MSTPKRPGSALDQPGLEELDVAGLFVHLRGDVHLVFQPAVLAEAELEGREFVGHAAARPTRKPETRRISRFRSSSEKDSQSERSREKSMSAGFHERS